jgi:GNAT superfamily N-acetyltransferase
MATLPVVVRAATRRDLLQLEAAFPFGPPEKHAERLDRQDRDKVVYLIAWRGDQPVGHGLLKWDGASEGHIRAAFGGTCPEVEDLFVVEASRSQGIGTQILQAAEKLATYRGFSRLGLSVDLRNVAARALYERLGYRDAGLGPYAERGHFIGRDGRREYWEETCVYLVKSLDPTVNRRS